MTPWRTGPVTCCANLTKKPTDKVFPFSWGGQVLLYAVELTFIVYAHA
jgi:hypothetical protein